MKKILIVVTILLTQFVAAQHVSDFFSGTDIFLKKHVANGKVDYQAIKNNTTELDSLLEIASKLTVSKNNPATYQAFYINAYNLAVIKGIVNNYPVKSPLDIKGFFDKINYQFAGSKLTLNDLENKMLREAFPSEARFHFVLVCAGLGCPPLISNAYLPETLENQLQKQTVLALNNPEFIKVKGNKIALSQLFEWYRGDFTQNGTEVDFINRFREEKIPDKSKVSYYPYNWSLNAK